MVSTWLICLPILLTPNFLHYNYDKYGNSGGNISNSFIKVLAILGSAALGYGLAYVLGIANCVQSKRKTDYSILAKAMIAVGIYLLIYGALLLVAPFFGKTPVTVIVSTVIVSPIAAFAFGIAIYLLLEVVISQVHYCSN